MKKRKKKEQKTVHKDNPEKERKILAIVMMICGGIVWIFGCSDGTWTSDLISGIGLFLFILGMLSVNKIKKPITRTQKIILIILIATLIILFLTGIIVYFQMV